MYRAAQRVTSVRLRSLGNRSLSETSIQYGERRSDARSRTGPLASASKQGEYARSFHDLYPTLGAYTIGAQERPLEVATQSAHTQDDAAPCNPVGVQLLERSLHRQLFPNADEMPKVDPMALDICSAHLDKHELQASQASKPTSTAFQLPPLQGKDLGEHFWTIGRRAAQPWLGYAETFATKRLPSPPVPRVEDLGDDSVWWSAKNWLDLDPSLRAGVPLQPTAFSTAPGWTRYPFLRTLEGDVAGLGDPESVPYPDVKESALVFDVEVLMTESQFPVMATAVSSEAWYSWVSPWLAGTGERSETAEHLIPMGPRNGSAPPRLIISHNAGFDRAAVLDEYTLHSSSIRWLDTMSLHVATSGISSPQRAEWVMHSRKRAERKLKKLLAAEMVEDDAKELIRALLNDGELDADALARLDVHKLDGWADEVKSSMEDHLALMEASLDVHDESSLASDSVEEKSSVLWQDITSRNSLAEVAALHCNIEMDKEARNKFIDGTPREQIREECAALLAYCAKDVATTHSVFCKVWPAFVERCPHPATIAGVLALGSTFLPVDEAWLDYQAKANAKFDEMNVAVVAALKNLTYVLKDSGVCDIDAYNADPERVQPWWTTDPWYAQLDWTPKRPKKGALPVDKLVPKWTRGKYEDPKTKLNSRIAMVIPLLRLRVDGDIVIRDDRRWVVRRADGTTEALSSSPLSQAVLLKRNVTSGAGPSGEAALVAIQGKKDADTIDALLRQVGEEAIRAGPNATLEDEQLASLDWTMVPPAAPSDPQDSVWWPKWFWDLYVAKDQDVAVSIRAKIAPLLLKLAWDECPLYRSRQHGWVYRTETRHSDTEQGRIPLTFTEESDPHICEVERQNSMYAFHKLPHANGDGSNVGNPFSKSFLPYFESSRLKSLHPNESGEQAAKGAVEMNAMCSYWISVRDRVEKQMVVWDGKAKTSMGFDSDTQRGLILPHVISMGTVTRRAIEKTWLTASNAKPNRIGSELKAMVRAPPGWCIVGADVDSEELWICSVMGDAQFGVHGATAIGWMTLEGSKSQGTDLHSKTASILGTSRNQAKVFNYSRIYGAGIKHATQLLLKANPSMPLAEATHRAKQLYAATKGNTVRSTNLFGRRFWYGGTESFVFNKLEEIATSDTPRTPALDCGITAALSKKHLPDAAGGNQDYMPSRINWVVQSSGVDYLHMLVAAMDHLCTTYQISARFMLSVHDEVRYLAKEEDKHRTALALQIANLWTRAMFAYKLNMSDLPETCAWFAEVDIDHVLRKEASDPCVTPSQPMPIAPGESLSIQDILQHTHNGSLLKDQGPMPKDGLVPGMFATEDPGVPAYVPSDQQHRCDGRDGLLFLQAQAASDINEVRALARRTSPNASKLTGSLAEAFHAHQADRPTRKRRRSMHTSAKPCSRFSDYYAMLPPRPVRIRQPMYKHPEYRAYVLHLYRKLLRAVHRLQPAVRDSLFPLLRMQMRHNKRITSRAQIWHWCASGKMLLEHLQTCADPASQRAIEASMEKMQALADRLASRRPPLPAPKQYHLTGALLPPTLFNPPMLRYKPDQPESMTMMIRDRRRRRERRMQQWSNVQEMAQLAKDECASLGGHEPAGNAGEWTAPLVDAERDMQVQFQREYARARMVFDRETLRRAKAAKHAKRVQNSARTRQPVPDK